MKLFRLLMAFALASSLSLTIPAKITNLEDGTHPAGWTFWLPDNWKAAPDGDRLEVEDKAGHVYMAFFVPKNAKDLNGALARLCTKSVRVTDGLSQSNQVRRWN